MRKLYDFPTPDGLELEEEMLVSIDSSDDDIERAIERSRPSFYWAWFEYIEEFES